MVLIALLSEIYSLLHKRLLNVVWTRGKLWFSESSVTG